MESTGIYDFIQTCQLPRYVLQWFCFGKYKSWYLGALEFYLGLRKRLNREEILSISRDGNRGSGTAASGGVFKNSPRVHLPVTVVLIVILGYFKGLNEKDATSCCPLFTCKDSGRWTYV